MSSKDAARGAGGGRKLPPVRVSDIRMEWMDPLSWRLPSGKALAEFALQAGFLAPLMLSGPRFKKKNGSPAVKASGTGLTRTAEKQFEEAPGSSGSFRESRVRQGFTETGF